MTLSWIELFLMALGLSMDAFAVAICSGLSMKKVTLKKSAHIGLYFGVFQALMPLLGYLMGSQFAPYIEAYDHWIAFVLLGVIGGKMIKDSFAKDGCADRECPEGGCADRRCPDGAGRQKEEPPINFKRMFPLAVATSIDALAVGLSLAFLRVDIVPAVSFIGVVTFLISMVGVKVGNLFGSRYKAKAEFAGGLILILIGLKILLEHLGVIM